MTELRMPRLSDSMEQGTILTWLKTDGETVRSGEELVEIETDKATVAHEAEQDGVLQIVAEAGTTLAVGEVIARIAAAREGADEGAAPAAAETQVASETPVGSSAVVLGDGAAVPASGDGAGSHPEVRATPLARRVANAHGVALAELTGTGPGGRVTRSDVLGRLGMDVPRPAAHAAPATPSDGVRVVEPTRLQAVVARRMTEAKSTVPEFAVAAEVAMDAAIALRQEIKRSGRPAPSLNDLIVKATALALREHPRANAAYRNGRFELYERIHIGIAVAATDALVVATITDADTRSLTSIAAEARRLAGKVRDGTVTPAELSGATFTVSNLGMYGMSHIMPIINSPQAAILGVGAARPVLARLDGEIVERQLMTLTLICDHRILYGADAAQLLSDIRRRLEEPLRLAL